MHIIMCAISSIIIISWTKVSLCWAIIIKQLLLKYPTFQNSGSILPFHILERFTLVNIENRSNQLYIGWRNLGFQVQPLDDAVSKSTFALVFGLEFNLKMFYFLFGGGHVGVSFPRTRHNEHSLLLANSVKALLEWRISFSVFFSVTTWGIVNLT